jgi:hypothetical protein
MFVRVITCKGAPLVLALTVALGTVQSAFAQLFAYPTAGQDQAQQSKDDQQCRQWAQQQSGFDPNRPPAQVQVQGSAPPSQCYSSGGTLRGAGRGAALGAVGGAIGGNAGRGAAIGAGVGALGGTMRRNSARRECEEWERQQQQMQQNAQQQANAQHSQGRDTFDRAWTACMEGRDYRVQ